jgi:hypothetical protein
MHVRAFTRFSSDVRHSAASLLLDVLPPLNHRLFCLFCVLDHDPYRTQQSAAEQKTTALTASFTTTALFEDVEES